MELYFQKKFKEFKEKLNISDENNELLERLESLLTNLIIEIKELDYSDSKSIKLDFKNTNFIDETHVKTMFVNIDSDNSLQPFSENKNLQFGLGDFN